MAVKFSSSGGPKKPAKAETDYSAHLGGAFGEAEVVLEKKSAGEKDYKQVGTSNEKVTAPQLAEGGTGCQIEVTGGKTINTGNYESARIAVTLRVPCTIHDLDETYQFASNWVSDKIEEATKAVS